MSNEYPHGVKVVLPNMHTNEAQVITFMGDFDKRKLRKMLRKTLFINDKRSLMFIIDTFVVKLKPMSMDAMLEQFSDEEA